MKIQQSQKGDGLVGLLIAAVVFAVGIAAVMQLQGGFFKSSSGANARTLAMNIGEETLETLRSFQPEGSTVANKGFVSIANNAGVGITNGTLTRGNIDFTRSWAVTDYYADVNGDLTTTVTGNIVQKKVLVTVAWTDTDGTAQSAVLDTVINQVNATAAQGALGGNAGGGGSKPDVPYAPSTDSKVVPIGVGTNSVRETMSTSSKHGDASTEFTAYTYEASGSHILLRQEDFQTIACDCTFDGSGVVAGPAFPKWNTSEKTYIDEEGIEVSKVKGVETKHQHIYCDICCRDHHDSNLLSQKFDPYRSADDFANGDHKHYNGTTVVTSGQYLESCRLKRVNGFWRVYQDWHMVDLTTLPISDLTNSTTRTKYQNYVKAVIDQHLDESKVSGQVLTSPPAIDTALNHTTLGNYVALGAVGDKRQLTARGIYLDYMYNTTDNPHLGEVKAEKTAVNDYLLHVPFYEVDVTELSDWSSYEPGKVSVGLQNSSLLLGEIQAEATTTGVLVTANIKYSNSGIVDLNSAVDYHATVNADDETRSDSVTVSVGGSTSTSTTTSSTSTSSTTTTTASSTTTTTTTSSLATCNTAISGRTAKKKQTPSLLIGGSVTVSCSNSGNNKKYTCPTQTTSITESITITSVGDTRIVTPICGSKTINFKKRKTCNTAISGRTAAKNQTPSLLIGGSVTVSCSNSGNNKKYTCPTQTTSITESITITSVGDTRIVTPICGRKRINFKKRKIR